MGAGGKPVYPLLEALALDVLLATNVSKATDTLRISWDEAWLLTARAVPRGRAVKDDDTPSQIEIDEKTIAERHGSMTLACDLEPSTMEYIGEGRSKANMWAYFEPLTQDQRETVEAISRDIWPAYIGACRHYVADVERKKVFDRFHIMRHALNAVDKVRKQEHNWPLEAGDDRLSRSKYLWLTNPVNMTDRARTHFADLKMAQLKTAWSWAIKESLRVLWDYCSKT